VARPVVKRRAWPPQITHPQDREEDFERFEQFGGYLGYRIGITADGGWRFFVSGD
jgi:hypothetical protein